MFGLQLPHRQIKLPNPVFSFDIKQVRRLSSAESLTRYGRVVLLVPYLLLMLWWLSIIVGFAQPIEVQRWEAYQHFNNVVLVLTLGLLILLPVAALILNVYSMAVTLNNIGHDMNTGHWEVLHLTPVSTKEYIAAKHSVAQVRAWRVMVIEIAVRMLSVVVTMITFTFTSFGYESYYRYYIQIQPLDLFTDSFKYHPLGTTALLITLILFVIVYIAEPLWRMRVLTAIGLAISARIHNLPFASLAGFGAILMFYLVQVAIVAGLALFRRGFSTYPGLTWDCVIVLSGIVANVLVFRVIYGVAIRYVERHVVQAE